jgi:hypothetical protein
MNHIGCMQVSEKLNQLLSRCIQLIKLAVAKRQGGGAGTEGLAESARKYTANSCQNAQILDRT